MIEENSIAFDVASVIQDESTPTPEASPRRRRSRAWPKDILAMKRFCREMEQLEPYKVEAAIKYLADRYLDIKPWQWR